MGQPQCTAKTRGSGGTERCKNRAKYGTTVCKKHGADLALQTRGPGSPHWKDGRYSKAFQSVRHRERFARSRNDEADALSHRAEIALLDVLLEDELESIGVDAGSAQRLWAKANDLLLDFEVGLRNKDSRAQQSAFIRLRETVREGQHDAEARLNARKLVQERGQMAEREMRRLLALEDVMTGEQASILFTAVIREISEAVKDPVLRADIHHRLMRLGGSFAADAMGISVEDDSVVEV